MTDYRVSKTIVLKSPTPDDAPALFELVDADRQTLRQWLPWADDTETVADEAAFLRVCQRHMVSGELWLAVIWVNNRPAGMIDLHNIHDGQAEVGYWLGNVFQGRGIMTQCLKTVEQIGFAVLHLRKLFLLAASANFASQGVAKRRHFQVEGRLRQQIPDNHDGYRDAVLFAKLASD
ncbi:GNAT family N-acetyltransferase [Levilactobacillus huananensis]|uniref:GNAT family N-acetyltransferase n=1 Tax=Levilactobacillus huananensis TaxID=2486019 RepID=UPI000F78B339|nr:GNAT family protein [Levilactobacillus huananensis]